MPRLYTPREEEKSKSVDLNQERYFVETLLSQRTHFFIIFFVVLVVGVIAAANFSHNYIVIVLSIGTIISWGLTLTILKLSLRIKYLDKKLGSEGTNIVTSFLKLPFKVLGWISDIFIPVLCSLLITTGLILSTSGYLDTKLIPPKVEEKFKESIKMDKDTVKKATQPERIKEFKSIDSVIQK
ncbi:MAG: hypothetical protein AB1432_09690 [Bacteroidota bacterium]